MITTERETIQGLGAAIRERGLGGADIAFVLGSGLGAFAERLEDPLSVPFAELPGLPQSRVAGHAGRLVAGQLAGRRVLVQQGRVHLYEGWSAAEVTRCVRAIVASGARSVVLTNAAGGLNEHWPPGTLMRLVDHVNLQGRSPLARAELARGTPYDAELGAALERAATESQVRLESGVYAGLLGPTYETPAEIRMLRWLGADTVGMSTVCEAVAAHAAGARVAAVSLVTNFAAGITGEQLSHDEVVETGKLAAQDFQKLLERAIPYL